MKSVRDILNGKILMSKTVNEHDNAFDAFALMETENTDYVIVVQNDICSGIISEVDYMHKIILSRANPEEKKVKDIMTACTHSIDINEPVHRCLEMMDTFKIRHVLVFEKGMFKGVVTLHDLMMAAFEGDIDNMLEQEQHLYVCSSNLDDKMYTMYN